VAEAGTGEVVERQEIGSVLVVRDGRVARFARHPDLGAALHAAGLARTTRSPPAETGCLSHRAPAAYRRNP
jgi:hypothetical protein